ncbi:MAG: hypothetical protein IT470_01710 [Pseudomonadales bacterium]|nr:hypothetical protein [Pseudomonadales bacterium]
MGRAYRSDDTEQVDRAAMEDVAVDDVMDEIVVVDFAEMPSRRDDAAETRSVSSRSRIREQLEEDIRAYLARGGEIHRAPPVQPHSHHV